MAGKKFEAERKKFVLIFAVSLGLTYGLASWAIDSGNLLLYLLTYLSTYVAVSNAWLLYKQTKDTKGEHGQKRAARSVKKAH